MEKKQEPIIVLRDVHKQFGASVLALGGVSLEVYPQEVVVVVEMEI